METANGSAGKAWRVKNFSLSKFIYDRMRRIGMASKDMSLTSQENYCLISSGKLQKIKHSPIVPGHFPLFFPLKISTYATVFHRFSLK